jgi:hypothetical protein
MSLQKKCITLLLYPLIFQTTKNNIFLTSNLATSFALNTKLQNVSILKSLTVK